MTTPFHGLSAFPLTPADEHGIVNTTMLSVLIDRLAAAPIASIGALGSTGIAMYLDRAQRARALAATCEAAAGRVPVVAGISALRTDWACDHARDAKAAGAQALLLAAVSYAPLSEAEFEGHMDAVACATDLPICLYNNPTTTRFVFSHDLIARLSRQPNVAAIKMPLPQDGHYEAELAALRTRCAEGFSIGYSGDWGMSPSLLAGADGFYSVLAGLMPKIMTELAAAAQADDGDAVAALEAKLAPVWALFRRFGGMRVVYGIAPLLRLSVGAPPRPLLPLPEAETTSLPKILAGLA